MSVWNVIDMWFFYFPEIWWSLWTSYMTIWTVLWSNWFTLLITGFLSLNTAYSSGNSKKNARRSVWMNKIVLLKLMRFLWRILLLDFSCSPFHFQTEGDYFPHPNNLLSQGFILFGTIYQYNGTIHDNCVLSGPSTSMCAYYL